MDSSLRKPPTSRTHSGGQFGQAPERVPPGMDLGLVVIALIWLFALIGIALLVWALVGR